MSHKYLVEAFISRIKPGKSRLNFVRVNADSTSESTYFSLDVSKRFLSSVHCREQVVKRVRGIVNKTFTGNDNVILGVRAFGEQYTTVAELLSKISRKNNSSQKKTAEFLRDFINRVFRINLDLEFGIIPKSKLKNSLAFSVTFPGKNGESVTRACNHQITLYMNSWENVDTALIDVKVSAILALLREPILVDKIFSGEIFDHISLARETMKISLSRATKKDDSYFCVSLSGIESNLKALQNRMKNVLAHRDNSDGSDWESMSRLAVFFYTIYETKTKDKVSTENGPANHVEKTCIPRRYTMFREAINDEILVKSFLQHCREYRRETTSRYGYILKKFPLEVAFEQEN